MERTIEEMTQALNDLLRGQYTVLSASRNEHMYEFNIDGSILSFNPWDEDRTLSKGLWNHGLVRT